VKLKTVGILLISLFFTGMILSCEVFEGFVQAAGAAGMDQKTVNSSMKAIKASSKSIDTALEDITPEQEYYIGRAIAANILAKYKLYTKNPKLTRYLNNICAAITINSALPYSHGAFKGYHVAILDGREINAFATPGGHIFVTRGLVSTAKSEDALAGVIAHEVAHIQLQHSIKAIKSSRFAQAISVTGKSTVDVASGLTGVDITALMDESVGDIVQTLFDNGYSQAQELDADNTAMRLLAWAGYNPSGLIDMLKALNAAQKPGEGFGKTHPSPATRISNAEITILLYGGGVKDTSAKRKARFASATK